MNFMRKRLIASAAAIVATIGSAQAKVETLKLGLQEQGVHGGAIVYEDTAVGAPAGIEGIGVDDLTFGAWKLVNASTNLNDVNGEVLSLGSQNSSENYTKKRGFGPALTIWVVDTGLTGKEKSISALVNTKPFGLPKGWTIKESAFYSPADKTPTLFGGTTGLISLGSITYTGKSPRTAVSGSGHFLSKTASFGGVGHPWSIVEEYLITPKIGAVGGAIHNGGAFQVQGSGPITGVPEPSTWAMMLTGFGALAFAGWRRREAFAA